MELKPGYKRTDVGTIPDDWFSSELQRLCRSAITYGIVQCGPHVERGVPYIRVSDMTARELDLSGMLRTSPEIAAAFARSRVEAGDLVYALRGRIGDVRLIRPALAGANLTQGTARLAPGEGIRSSYLLWALRGRSCLKQADLEAKGSTFREITLANLRGIHVAVPPLPEQEAIATTLSDADELIDCLERLIAKKRQLKQGAIQELLTGKRRILRPTSRLPRKRTELGYIPSDWTVRRLGDLFEITSSKRVFQREWKSAGIPFYRAREIAVLGVTGVVENELFISSDHYAKLKANYGIPRVGDMLVTGVGTLGKTYVVSGGHEFYFKDGNILWFKCAGKVDARFLSQLYLTPIVARQISDGSAGTTVGTYTIEAARRTLVPYPPIEEQNAIADCLQSIDEEISGLQAKIEKQRRIKQGMMQELLTGRIRLVCKPTKATTA